MGSGDIISSEGERRLFDGEVCCGKGGEISEEVKRVPSLGRMVAAALKYVVIFDSRRGLLIIRTVSAVDEIESWEAWEAGSLTDTSIAICTICSMRAACSAVLFAAAFFFTTSAILSEGGVP